MRVKLTIVGAVSMVVAAQLTMSCKTANNAKVRDADDAPPASDAPADPAAAPSEPTEAGEQSEASPDDIAQRRKALADTVNRAYAAERQGVTANNVGGKWDFIEQDAEMQAIHMIVVPDKDTLVNGDPTGVKVLVVSGTSNRNQASPNVFGDADNSGLISVTPNGPLRLRKVASPKADDNIGMDLFCGGHLQTFQGDALFVGGTREYIGTGQFTGNRKMWLFDWRQGAFVATGNTEDGRWYPSLEPLADGRIAIVGGLTDRSPNEISTKIEVYNPNTRKVTTLRNTNVNGSIGNMIGGNGNRKIPMYPRIVPLRDGRHLLTGDGVGFMDPTPDNLNTLFFTVQGNNAVFAQGPRRTGPHLLDGRTVNGNDNLLKHFYPTQILDPRPNAEGHFLIIGGAIQEESLDTNQFIPGRQSTSDMVRYAPDGGNGGFSYEEDFMGNFPGNPAPNLDRRENHVATYLPTGDFMIFGGGNFGYSGPKFKPLLYTPAETGNNCDFGRGQNQAPRNGFCRTVMNPHTFPRLYHTTAALLPDGRVLLGGGNAGRANWRNANPATHQMITELSNPPNGKPNLSLFANQQFQPRDGQGQIINANPAEEHYFEVYSPPYLFNGPRPELGDVSNNKPRYGDQLSFSVNNGGDTRNGKVTLIKLGSITHAMDNGERLANLQFTANGNNVTATMPGQDRANLYPPGYYMLFFVRGDTRVPSVAKLVQLGADKAATAQ